MGFGGRATNPAAHEVADLVVAQVDAVLAPSHVPPGRQAGVAGSLQAQRDAAAEQWRWRATALPLAAERPTARPCSQAKQARHTRRTRRTCRIAVVPGATCVPPQRRAGGTGGRRGGTPARCRSGGSGRPAGRAAQGEATVHGTTTVSVAAVSVAAVSVAAVSVAAVSVAIVSVATVSVAAVSMAIVSMAIVSAAIVSMAIVSIPAKRRPGTRRAACDRCRAPLAWEEAPG